MCFLLIFNDLDLGNLKDFLNLGSTFQCRYQSQLKSTIQIFNEALKNDFLGYDIEAYVCTPPHYPNKGTALDAFVLEFIEDFGGISLFEKNERTFL